MRIVVAPSVISQPAAPRCVRRTRALPAPGLGARVSRPPRRLMAVASATAGRLAGSPRPPRGLVAIPPAAGEGPPGPAGDLPRLDQPAPHVVRRLHERDARAVR